MSEHMQRHDTDQPSRIVTGSPQSFAPHHKLQKAPPMLATDEDAQPARDNKRLDRRSLEYMLKSGLAGGLAGCAVRTLDTFNTFASQPQRNSR
jgi:hypothetical protein